MYQRGDTYYTEDHSVSFGSLQLLTSGGNQYYVFNRAANTWTDWHLIPSSRPSIAHPTIVTKYIEIPGSDEVLDLTEWLSGRPNYGQRQGSLSFIVANGIENWETIREKMVRTLHGKRIMMLLEDDPGYYYQGRFTVGQWETGKDYSSINISYQLDPYKMRVNGEGSFLTLWDTFNFETDYDYAILLTPLTVSGSSQSVTIYSGDYSFTPFVQCVSGSVTLTFGGVTQTVSQSDISGKSLGPSVPGANTLVASGTGSVIVTWRGGSL